MVTFKEYEYKRPELDVLSKDIRILIDQFRNAETVEAQIEIMEQINKKRDDFGTQSTLVYIRASINTNDEFYQKERDYFDEISTTI